MPIEVNVDEKPCPITVAMPEIVVSPSLTSTSGMPPISPNTSATAMIVRNGWIFSFEIMKISTTIASTNTTIRGMPVTIELLRSGTT